jgi:hypothetical protein
MNKIKKSLLIFFLIIGTGLTYTVIMLKNIPESFDWNLEEDEYEDY